MSGVSAVVLNVTATEAEAAGFVTVWPTGQERPNASNLNLERVGQTIPNLVVVPVGAGGRVSLYAQSAVHLLADVAGWFSDASAGSAVAGLFVPVAPARVLDTRDGTGTVAGALGPDASVDLGLGARGGLPASGMAAVVLNITRHRGRRAGLRHRVAGRRGPACRLQPEPGALRPDHPQRVDPVGRRGQRGQLVHTVGDPTDR